MEKVRPLFEMEEGEGENLGDQNHRKYRNEICRLQKLLKSPSLINPAMQADQFGHASHLNF